VAHEGLSEQLQEAPEKRESGVQFMSVGDPGKFQDKDNGDQDIQTDNADLALPDHAGQ
jgi:hypothetical protein